uniref:hypothetical protein n=1 Tax=Flavobacterium sp. TaxID=239 RepID=UPI00404AA800
MKKGLLIGGILLVVCLGIYFLYPTPPPPNPWDEFNHFDDAKLAENVEAYYDATMGYKVEEDAIFDVYTEMSMDFGYMAYQMPDNKEFAGDVFFELGKIHHYLIEQKGVVDGGEIIGKDGIINKLIDPTVYSSTGVDIEAGLNQLVNNNRPALLITDFEQWDQYKGKELHDQAIYNSHFKEWLERPNHSITFYYGNFCDAATDAKAREGNGKSIMKDRFHKKIFFAFFDVDKERSFSKKAMPVKVPGSFKSMVIDIAPYRITDDYGSMDKSGIGMGLEAQVTKVLQGLPKNKNFEFINVGKYNWVFIDKTIQNKKGDPFFQNLALDASNNTAFDLKSLRVEVNDVTDDFTYFVRCNHAHTLKPKIIQDKKTGKDIFDPSTDQIAQIVYDPATGKLKSDWVYGVSTAKSYTAFTEFFDINKMLFDNSKKRSNKKIKVEVMMHRAYNASKMTQKNGLLRVDVIADKVDKNYAIFDGLTWDSPSNNGGAIQYQNTSLTKSIQSALKELEGGQIIYSYYIRVLPSKK